MREIFFFILGLIFGSFFNVLIYRIPLFLNKKKKKYTKITFLHFLSFPQSHCIHCKEIIRWFENLPVISWLFLGGKCSYCKKVISFRYPLVELLTGFIFLYCFHKFSFSPPFIYWLIFFSFLLILFFIDLESFYLPSHFTLFLILIGPLISFFEILIIDTYYSLAGLLFGYLLLFFINLLFKIIRKKDGLGGGDFLLLSVFGSWFGPFSILPILALSSFLGIIFVLILSFFGKSIALSSHLPFGPFLILSALMIYIHQYEYTFYFLKFYGL